MASFRYGIGKGLREPCSPYREAYVFGAGLNEPKAGYWNCMPAVVGSTTSFDLSAISPGREVVVALLGISGAPAGNYAIRFRWYRERDNALLYDYTFNYTLPGPGFLYSYSYIGYVDWEINENGSYRVEITATGPTPYTRIINFTVSGIPEVPPEPVPSLGFMAPIVSGLNSIAAFFYFIYLEVNGWTWPFWMIGSHLYEASGAFSKLAWRFYDFSEWVDAVSDQVLSILNWETVWSYILSYIPNLVEIRDWFYNWYSTVLQLVDNWWSSTSTTVLGWIDEAKQWTQLWIDSLQAQVDELRVMIQDIPGSIPGWTEILTDIQALINTAFTIREDFWAGWQDWRSKVAEFFSDPEDWLYKSFDRIIERFW